MCWQYAAMMWKYLLLTCSHPQILCSIVRKPITNRSHSLRDSWNHWFATIIMSYNPKQGEEVNDSANSLTHPKFLSHLCSTSGLWIWVVLLQKSQTRYITAPANLSASKVRLCVLTVQLAISICRVATWYHLAVRSLGYSRRKDKQAKSVFIERKAEKTKTKKRQVHIALHHTQRLTRTTDAECGTYNSYKTRSRIVPFQNFRLHE